MSTAAQQTLGQSRFTWERDPGHIDKGANTIRDEFADQLVKRRKFA
jgi:hypothetical protein